MEVCYAGAREKAECKVTYRKHEPGKRGPEGVRILQRDIWRWSTEKVMNNHYLPCLLLRQFATGKKINTYDFRTMSFHTKKLKDTFASKDLFDPELEKAFAVKIEGTIGNILNHKLLVGNDIILDRKENLLLRKFVMINNLRNPLLNGSWEDMVQKTRLQDHPTTQLHDFLCRHHPEMKKILQEAEPSKESYISNLKTAMDMGSVMDMLDGDNEPRLSTMLRMTTELATVATFAFWDCSETGQEFILPQLPGISLSDQGGTIHKFFTIQSLKHEMQKKGINEELELELQRLIYGAVRHPENFVVYPLSPTRMLVGFSPYFRAFFPIWDPTGTIKRYLPLLDEMQFHKHFFEPMQRKLFEPCKSIFNEYYHYTVKKLTAEEVMGLNALMLNMETQEFAFHDYNRIRDSFWYYDKKAKFAYTKQHDFSHMG